MLRVYDNIIIIKNNSVFAYTIFSVFLKILFKFADREEEYLIHCLSIMSSLFKVKTWCSRAVSPVPLSCFFKGNKPNNITK